MQQRCTPALVINILAMKVGVPSDTPAIDTAYWEELGVDSLGLSEVFANLGHQLGVEIPQERAIQASNVQELVAFVNTQL